MCACGHRVNVHAYLHNTGNVGACMARDCFCHELKPAQQSE